MYRSKEEKLADIMLGEAVLKILHDGDAINSTSLSGRLTEMAAREKNSARHEACLRAISTVLNGTERPDAIANGSGKVTPLFAQRRSVDDGNKN